MKIPKLWPLLVAAFHLTIQSSFSQAVLRLAEQGHLNEVREDAGSAPITIQRSGNLSFAVTVRLQTLNRSAIAGADYGFIDTVVFLDAFQSSATVNVPIVADSFFEGNERILLKLSAPSSGAVFARGGKRESLFINDAQDDPFNDDFAAAAFLPGGAGSVSGNNQGASREPGEPIHMRPRNRSVWYTYTAPGNGFAKFRGGTKNYRALLAAYTGNSVGALTAVAPFDDSEDSDDSDDFGTLLTVKVRAGQTYHLAVDDSDDSDVSETPEDSDDSNDGQGGGGRSFLLKWRTLLPGKLQFSAPTYSVKETKPAATITVTRTGGASRQVSVRYETQDGTAVAGEDYTATSGELTFLKGQRKRTFTVPILTDSLFEVGKTVRLSLRRPRGGARLARADAKLTIINEDPFTPGAGRYTALISQPVFVHDETGRLSIKTSVLGRLTGKLRLGSAAYSFHGRFDGQNHLIITKRRKNLPALTIDLQLSADGAEISGTVVDGAASIDFTGMRNGFRKTDPAPQAGRYTILLPGDDLSAASGFPKGDGWATLKVSASGTGRVVGVLADGRVFSTSIALSKSGDAPFYASLYRRKGSLSGVLAFADNPGVSAASATMRWFKPDNARTTGFYDDGFSIELPLLASAYDFTKGQRALATLDATNGQALITFGEGNLPADLTQTVKVTQNNLVTVPPSPAVRMNARIREKFGLFAGAFKRPGTTREIPFRGVIFQEQGRAAGFFLGKSESGFARLAPAP